MAEQPTEKTCTKCGETKPLEEYYRSKKAADGRTSQCAECRKASTRRWNAENKDKKSATGRAYYQRNREQVIAYQRDYHAANRDDCNARRMRYYRENEEKEKARKARWQADNSERLRERARAYYQENREYLLEKGREWRAANPEAVRAYYEATRDERKAYMDKWREDNRSYLAQYRKNNPQSGWRSSYRWRATRFGFTPIIEDFTKADVIAKYGDHCAYCETGEFESLDHYIPVKAGGPHTLENVRPSCAGCNNAKRDSDPEEWLAEQAEFDALTEDEQNALIDAEIAKYLTEED